MDDQTLSRAFACILGMDNDARKAAERLLASLEGTEGLYPRLCSFALSEQNDLQMRQSAVLFLKNSCMHWKEAKRQKLGKPQIPETDKVFLRTQIIQFLRLSVEGKVRLQFEEIAKSMAEGLFPQDWPEVQTLLDQSLLVDDRDLLYAGLTLLHQLAKTFEYNTTEHRTQLPALSARYFPRLQQCFLLLPLEEKNFSCLVLILKSYHAVTYIDYPADLASLPCFDTWIGRMKELLELPLGDLERIPTSEDDTKFLEENPAWLCKRWCAQIVQRCFQRETNLLYLNDQVKLLTQHYCEKFSLPLVETSLNLLLVRSTRFLPNYVANYLWKLITQGAKSERTKSMVREHAPQLLTQVLLPQVYRVPSDQVEWDNNPIEFIRKENDLAQAFYSAKASAVDFLITLCADPSVLREVLSFLNTQFQANPSPLHKEALMLLFGSLAELVNKQESLRSNIETGLKLYVFSDLENPVGFLKSRAVSVYGMFASVQMTDEQHQEGVIRTVCRLLLDPALPVRIEAAITLSKIIAWPCARRIIEPDIKNLLDVFLHTMDQIDSEELMDSMETLVGFFSNAIVPYAVALSTKLKDAFQRMAESEPKEDDGVAAMAAVSTLNILIKVLEAVREHPDQLLQVSRVLMPVLDYTLSPKGDDFFEEGLSLLSDLLYYPETGSLPHLFDIYPYLLVALVGSGEVKPYASDHIELMYIPLANFISKYREQFLRRNGIAEILQVANSLLALDEDSIGYEYHLAVKLLLCLLENYKGLMNDQIPTLGHIVVALFHKKPKALQLLGIELLSLLCWHSPVAALSSLQGEHEAIMLFWLQHISKFSTESGKLHIAVGLQSFIENYTYLPTFIAPHVLTLLRHLIQVLKDLVSMEESEETQEDVVDLIKKLKARTNEEEEEDDDDWSPIDEDLYDSPLSLDGIVLSLGKLFGDMKEKDPNTFAGLDTHLTAAEKQDLSKLLAKQPSGNS